MTLLAGWAIADVLTKAWRERVLVRRRRRLRLDALPDVPGSALGGQPGLALWRPLRDAGEAASAGSGGIVLALFLGLVWFCRGLCGAGSARGAPGSRWPWPPSCCSDRCSVHSAWTLAYEPKEGEPLAPEATSLELRSLASDLSSAGAIRRRDGHRHHRGARRGGSAALVSARLPLGDGGPVTAAPKSAGGCGGGGAREGRQAAPGRLQLARLPAERRLAGQGLARCQPLDLAGQSHAAGPGRAAGARSVHTTALGCRAPGRASVETHIRAITREGFDDAP